MPPEPKSSRGDQWTIHSVPPSGMPRELLSLKPTWDVDELYALEPGWDPSRVLSLGLLDGGKPFGYAILTQSPLYRTVTVDTLILLPDYRTPVCLGRVYRKLHALAMAWAGQLGYGKVRWATAHPKAMKRWIDGATQVETIMEVEVG